MSHLLQYTPSHQIYPSKQQQSATYSNTVHIPMMLGISSGMLRNNTSSNLGSDSSIDVGYSSYLHNLGMDLASPPSSGLKQDVMPVSDNTQPPSLISIRRDSGFAHSSLNELSMNIMSPNSNRRVVKGEVTAHPRHSAHNLGSLQSSDSSVFLSSPSSITSSTAADGSTPIVPSMPNNAMDYLLNNVQCMYLQNEQQNQHTMTSASAPSAHYTAYSPNSLQGPSMIGSSQSSSNANNSWNMTAFSSSTNLPTAQSLFANNGLMSAVYGVQQQQQNTVAIAPSHQVQEKHLTQQKLMSPLQYHPRQGQIQRPRQRKPQLQIVIDDEHGQQIPVMAPNVNIVTSGFSAQSAPWDSLVYEVTQPSAPVASPSMSAASNIVQAGQQDYSWGFVSSPVESSFSSESSTPSFASPSSSYTYSEMTPSCQSSRAASPSSAYDGFVSERRIRRVEFDGLSSSIIRSRKSSTSSTSSMGSQRRTSNLREPSACGILSPTSPQMNQITSTTSPTHQCPQCGQCFAGPAVLVRHIESIHEKLLWNCVGCKSNLSRRDAVTRHINLSPMDSICRAVGTIGQVKTSNGIEVHYEVSSYRAKPLDEVMNRMGKKISAALRKEIDRTKAAMRMREAHANATAATAAASAPTLVTAIPVAMQSVMEEKVLLNTGGEMEMCSMEENGFLEDGASKKRKLSLMAYDDVFGPNKK